MFEVIAKALFLRNSRFMTKMTNRIKTLRYLAMILIKSFTRTFDIVIRMLQLTNFPYWPKFVI